MDKIFGANWQTTLTGLGVIIGLAIKIIAAVKVKDFSTVFTDAKELIPDIIALLMGLGLLAAKDAKVQGAGDAAKRVE